MTLVALEYLGISLQRISLGALIIALGLLVDDAMIAVEMMVSRLEQGDPHKYRPDSKETADYSLPFCMAAGLVHGMVTPLQFKEERVLDKALIPIMAKVKVVANQEFEALFPKFQPSRVTITTNSGTEHSTRVDVPKGDPRDPMTEEEIAVKFNALGGDIIGKDQCQKLQNFIMSMETAKDLGGLFELTTAR
jgi:2-methylcitrate dehydratase